MSKVTNKLNQIWYEVAGENIKMGLTRSFLSQLDECWHIIPPNGRRIREKAPLFTVETNDSLVSVLSPVAGNFLEWNDRATNFPDKLSESDVIIQLTTAAVPEPVENSREWLVAEIARLDAIVRDGNMPMPRRLASQTLQQERQRELNDRFGRTPDPVRPRGARMAQEFTTTMTASVGTTHWNPPPGMFGDNPARGILDDIGLGPQPAPRRTF